MAPEDEPESELLVVGKRLGVVPVHVVTPVSAGAYEWSIGVGTFVSKIRVDVLDVGAERQKTAAGIEVAALQPGRELVGERLALTNVNNAQSAEITIFRAEWAIDDGHILDQFGAEGF